MDLRLFLCGLGIWLGATVALRVAGQHFLPPDDWAGTLLLFAGAFPAAAWITRSLCRRFRLPREAWPAGTVSLLLPTLLFDAFSSAFFSAVFPNMAPEAAGTFGGWMLWCCASALLSATVGARPPS